jgi:hypothetical protein
MIPFQWLQSLRAVFGRVSSANECEGEPEIQADGQEETKRGDELFVPHVVAANDANPLSAEELTAPVLGVRRFA